MGNEKQEKKRDGRTQGVRVSAYVSHLTGVCVCVFKFMQFATRFQHTYIHTIERLDSAALLLERACTRERVMQWQQHVCSADAVRRPHGYFIYLRATGNPVTAILNWYIFVILCCSPNRFRAVWTQVVRCVKRARARSMELRMQRTVTAAAFLQCYVTH